MTKKEKAWCLRHAKEHVLEALDEVLTDEHHSLMKIGDAVRNDMHTEVMKHLEWMRRLLRGYKP